MRPPDTETYARKRAARALRAQNLTVKEIARRLGVSYSTAWYWCQPDGDALKRQRQREAYHRNREARLAKRRARRKQQHKDP